MSMRLVLRYLKTGFRKSNRSESMGFRRMAIFCSVAAIFLYWNCCHAQVMPDRIRQSVLDSIANPPMDMDSSIVFDFTEISISIKDTDSPRTLTFPFVNKGKSDVTVTRVAASCGCTIPRFSTMPVKPGERGEITVVYNPHNQTGTINRAVYVYTNASSLHPVVRLSVKGKIIPADKYRGYPYPLGTLRVKRADIDFGKVTSSSRRSERILCVNAGSSPLKVRVMQGLTPAWVSVRTVPETIASGEEAELFVEIDGSGIPSGNAGAIDLPLILDGIPCPPSKRTIRLRFTFQP